MNWAYEMGFDNLRKNFPLRAMEKVPNHPDELILMTIANGRLHYRPPPRRGRSIRLTPDLPKNRLVAAVAKYLWVVINEDVPHGLENCSWGRSLNTDHGLIKHSNLTGGDSAYVGGELWFVDPYKVIINFNSGRYGLKFASDLPLRDSVLDALMQDGYIVSTTGVDPELPYISSEFLIGDPDYRSATDGRS